MEESVWSLEQEGPTCGEGPAGWLEAWAPSGLAGRWGSTAPSAGPGVAHEAASQKALFH